MPLAVPNWTGCSPAPAATHPGSLDVPGFHAHNELIRSLGGGLVADEGFYLATMDLVDLAVAVAVAVGGLVVALVEGIAARRRAYAALWRSCGPAEG
ncbi:hypothetical protein [Micromonospora sp. KC213]|uniref:hypothetical protein n=1 Tax=Micromonospora sp. KC213 TaxID=2530378 RepID=UPI0010476F1C|nr:hypothetical protein [Micromonospora sp. KC213]TDC40129.1 hypothetical protein E1166_15305 [Micromonospora sp. KC213]